jgi:hypothetical protein
MLDVEDVVEVFLRIAETNVLVERDRTGRLLRMRVPLGLSLPCGAELSPQQMFPRSTTIETGRRVLRYLPSGGSDIWLDGCLPLPVSVVFGAPLYDRADCTCDLGVGFAKHAAGDDQLCINDHDMVVFVGCLDHELWNQTAHLAHLVDKPGLLRERYCLVRGISCRD